MAVDILQPKQKKVYCLGELLTQKPLMVRRLLVKVGILSLEREFVRAR